jgi:voltage-gated sodium channel
MRFEVWLSPLDAGCKPVDQSLSTDSSENMTAEAVGRPLNFRARIERIVSSDTAQRLITTAILINAVTLGIETSDRAMEIAGPLLVAIDHIVLGIFVVELLAKLFAFRLRFFRSGWNWFDLAIVGVSLLPATGSLSVLRALRILRVLRLLSVVPSMRTVVEALLSALPGMGAIVAVLLLIFYVGSVLVTKLFGDSFPDMFGTIGRSMLVLFQLMTLDGWSQEIVKPVMEQYPQAWIFFVPFIVLTSFAVLNLFIGVIVESLQSFSEARQAEQLDAAKAEAHEDAVQLEAEIRQLRRDVSEIRALLQAAQSPGR